MHPHSSYVLLGIDQNLFRCFLHPSSSLPLFLSLSSLLPQKNHPKSTKWLAMFQDIGAEDLEKPQNNAATLGAEGSLATLNHATDLPPATSTSGATLLPRPIASFVSFLTHSTSLSLRLGTLFGGVAIDGARATTLTGLELSRTVIEGVLTRAGRDVAIRSTGERGKIEADSLLERSVS